MEPEEYTVWKDNQVENFLRANTNWRKRRRGADIYYLNEQTKETSLAKPQVCMFMYMYLCMYVCMYVCLYYMYVYAYIHVCMYIYMYAWLYMCVRMAV